LHTPKKTNLKYWQRCVSILNMPELVYWRTEMSDARRQSHKQLLKKTKANPPHYRAMQAMLQGLDRAGGNHQLTGQERVALVRNLRLILGKSIPDLRNENNDISQRAKRTLDRQVNLPRFRFLNQIPQARTALLNALRGTGVRFQGAEQESVLIRRSWLFEAPLPPWQNQFDAAPYVSAGLTRGSLAAHTAPESDAMARKSTRHLPRRTKPVGRHSGFPKTPNQVGTPGQRQEGTVAGRDSHKKPPRDKTRDRPVMAKPLSKDIPEGRAGTRDHVSFHGHDTHTTSGRAYVAQARRFFQSDSTRRFHRQGKILHYNLNSLEFGVTSIDGKTIYTYHRNFANRPVMETYLAKQGLPHVVILILNGNRQELSLKRAQILVKREIITPQQLDAAPRRLT
jgi:hypothetical protein